MRHDAHLIRTDTGEEFIFPVPPENFVTADEIDFASEYVQEVGDVYFPGLRTPGTITLSGLLIPAQAYPFASSSTTDPHSVADRLADAMREHVIFRYVETGSTVNRRVFLTGVERREQDGTDDLYLNITMREYTELSAPEVQPAGAGGALQAREDDWARTTANVYVPQPDDTWYTIARDWYHDESLADALAAYNGSNGAMPLGTDSITLPPTQALQMRVTPYSADHGYTPALANAVGSIAAAAAPAEEPDATDLYDTWYRQYQAGLTSRSWPDWYKEYLAAQRRLNSMEVN